MILREGLDNIINGFKGALNIADKFMSRVVIYNKDYYIPILPMVSPLNVEIVQERNLTKATVEDGTQVTDHLIQYPKKITIDVHTHSYLHNTYLVLNQIYKSRETVTIQTTTGIFYDMLLTSIPIRENRESRGSLYIKLQFQELVKNKAKFSLMNVKNVSSALDATTEKVVNKIGEKLEKGSFLFNLTKGWL